ncbi:GTPase IMAP family member 8 isoform X2 [Misgurnus anguillicaudatus]|uniref:GTPase IMAP family member 8 isoform X2 n=1 Tax=Misgurnus anguillicaudatus TaxID=75329 RepID=UPI003CCF1F9B
MLGRSALDSEAPPDDHQIERVRGKDMMIINCPHLLQLNLSYHQIIQTVRECVNLSHPGPHLILLILQHHDFSEDDKQRVKFVLKCFSDQVMKHTILLTTGEDKPTAVIHELTTECGGHLHLDSDTEGWSSKISHSLEKIVKENHDEYLKCKKVYDTEEGSSVDEESIRSFRSEEESDVEEEKHRDTQTNKKETKSRLRNLPILRRYWSTTEQSPDHDRQNRGVTVINKEKLNLVLCGSDDSLKTFVLELIREKSKSLSVSHERELEVCGRLINLMELPALTQLSEDEGILQTHHCLSLCDPGVHVFLLILPNAPLTDEDKAEMKKIHRVFSSRINKHVITVIIKIKRKWLSKISMFPSSATQTVSQEFEGHNFVLENKSQIPSLLQDVERMVQENSGGSYTTFMFLQAQIEVERNKHRAEIEELRRTVMRTQRTAAGVSHSEDDDLRIVLLGKTGVGKSASGNTILRREAFKSLLTAGSVTRQCQKETSEIKRRKITVIDTPGLFDTEVDNVDSRKEIVKCISMAAPGPHAFLLVLQLGRFTQEEKDAVKMIQESFGEKSSMYTMLLFTRGDDLKGTTIEDFLKSNDSLQTIIRQCGNRYQVFNNNETKDHTQVNDLIDKIGCMMAANGGSYYSNEMFQLVEKNIKEEQERIMKEKEEEIKKREEELKAKYEAESEKLKKENEREREEMQNELRRREEEFKMRKEEIKKETDENLQKELQSKLSEQQKEFEAEIKRKEKTLQEQQVNFIKYLEEKHERHKQTLQTKIQRETREQAEREYLQKLDEEVAKALQKAEEKLSSRSKRARDWSHHGSFVGGAAGGFYGTGEDLVHWIISKCLNRHDHQNIEQNPVV